MRRGRQNGWRLKVAATAASLTAACANDPSDTGQLAEDEVQPHGAIADDAGVDVPVVLPSGAGDSGDSEATPTLIQPSPEPIEGVDVSTPLVCDRVPVELSANVLAIYLDVSASMGSGQKPYWSRELKWEPTIEALRGFLEDGANSFLAASLTFFPSEAASTIGQAAASGEPFDGGAPLTDADDDGPSECRWTAYASPDVSEMALPSDTFATELDAVTPETQSDWRLGAPLRAVVEGAATAAGERRAGLLGVDYSIVLVTDGQPDRCGPADDSIAAVAIEAENASVVAPVHVIAILDPATEEEPNPPDFASELDEVAVAGGTTSAHQVDTSNPNQTRADVRAALEAIAAATSACHVDIPEPPEGETFDPAELYLELWMDSVVQRSFSYDPTCSASPTWYYDDESNPSYIALCPDTCSSVREALAFDGAELIVVLGCQRPLP